MIRRRQALALFAATSLMPTRAFAQIATARFDVRIDLAKYFDDDGTAGVFAAYAAGDNRIVTSDGARSRLAFLPASTFKIANSIIALETGVVTDPDKDVFKWDGTVRNFPDWNRDHTLRSAIAASALPVYQEIARRIVGWAEKDSTVTVFALNLDIREPRHIASRMKLAQRQLSDLGAI
jgi:beta-lactamase class D